MLIPFYLLTVLLGGLALMMRWIIQGKNIYVVAPLCAFLVIGLSGEDVLAGMTGAFMNGFSDYMRRFFLVFALGAAFGGLMQDSGAAVTVASESGRVLGAERACLAVVLAGAILTYGGVSLFVVGFSVYPIAVQLFRVANLPRRYIPGAIAFGTVTFTMTSAGSPEIQNLIPIKELGTDARAGWPASLIVAVVMFVLGQIYLEWVLRRAVARGERFEPRDSDPPAETLGESPKRPGLLAALVPLLVTLLALNVLPTAAKAIGELVVPYEHHLAALQRLGATLRSIPEDATLSIFLGVVAALVGLRRYCRDTWTSCGSGFASGLMACAATSSVVGFGKAMETLPAFQYVVGWVTKIPVEPMVGAALAVALISMIAGSASGGQGIALPIIKPIYVDLLGVPPRALHRVVSIASGTLDSLPHNGYIVILIRNICGETHQGAYGPIFVTTVLIPIVGTALAIALFKLFPSWAHM